MAGPNDIEEEEGGDEDGGAPGWLTTWADMMSVLLTFFIVLQAFSTLSEKKFYEAISSIQTAFRVPLPIRSPGADQFQVPPTEAAELENMLDDKDVKGSSVQDFGDRIVMTIDSEFLFEPGIGELSERGRSLVTQIARTLRGEPGEIRVEGHTDDQQPGPGAPYQNNWQLSSARAMQILMALEFRGIAPERLGAAGYGEHRPVAPNDTPENRARNRRVEFVIEKKKGMVDRFR